VLHQICLICVGLLHCVFTTGLQAQDQKEQFYLSVLGKDPDTVGARLNYLQPLRSCTA